MTSYSVSLKRDLNARAIEKAKIAHNGSVEDYLRGLIYFEQAVEEIFDTETVKELKQRAMELGR